MRTHCRVRYTTLFAGGAILLVALGACASMNRAAGLDPALPASIEVIVNGQPDVVESRVFAALVRDGWTVSDRKQGLLTVGPYKPAYDHNVELLLRATFINEGEGSTRVTLSGVVASDALMEMANRRLIGPAGATASQGQPIRQATSGRALKNWQELERLAATVRAGSA